MSYIDKLAWIYIEDRRVLGTRSRGKDICYIPGGKREDGESDHQALIREIWEELAVNLVPETIQFVEQFEAQAHGKPEGVMVRMSCYAADYEGELKASAEIEEIYWLTHRERAKSSPVDVIILDWLKGKDLID